MDDSERRVSPRLPQSAEFSVRELSFPVGTKPAVAVEMVDVSDSGVGFRSPVAFAVDAGLEAILRLPGWFRHTQALDRFRADERPLTAVARVIRCRPLPDGLYDVGVQFTDIWDDHWRAMRRHIEDLLSEPAK